MVRVKICGVTSVEDALLCAEAGVDAVGVNFAAGSPRRVSLALGREIVASLPPAVLSVGVFVDADFEELREIQQRVGLGCLQLHGVEPPELLVRLLPHAYKAIRVQGETSIAEAARYAGEHILLDAHVPGVAGGTGHSFDWSLAARVAQLRKLTLAGGLRPDNVASAIAAVRPFCVDVASGVESSPGKKDRARLLRFVAAVRGAALQ
jgi:phosphoribosylanthranilate isomerase